MIDNTCKRCAYGEYFEDCDQALLDQVRQLKARLAELEAQTEPAWIPVSVRLPECDKVAGAQSDRVACLTNILERTIGWLDWNTFEEGYTWDWIEKHFTGTYIIAWYPIPPVKVQE